MISAPWILYGGNEMAKTKKFFSIKTKMYIFVMITILLVASGTAALAFYTSANQINDYYKNCAADNAQNFATYVDGDFLEELRAVAESDEFQALRDRAEEEDDDEPIREYLIEHGMWEKYKETQDAIMVYLENMNDIKYLYLIVVGDKDAVQDMYLMDAADEPLYQTGYYEDRETELLGLDLFELKEPTISNGDWGWLCSAFSPVCNSEGRVVCAVGCDFGMDDVMKERQHFLIYLMLGALLLTIIIMIGAVFFIQKVVVQPLNSMTREMERFKPAEDRSYEEAGVMELPIRSNDEIGAIYHGIRTMQTNIIDYLNDLSALQKDKMKAEQVILDKEKKIDELSEENNRDVLTGVGSNAAYGRKVIEINKALADGSAEFAIIMVDVNNLKKVNDEFGHKAGDQYIKGCCRMVCNAFKHSPVFRIGGDEFIVIAQGSDYHERHALFDKLKDEFAATYAQTDTEAWLRYSASLGMAENASGDTSVDLVFRRADKAMYEDKMQFKKEHGSYR